MRTSTWISLLAAIAPLSLSCVHAKAFMPLNRTALRASNPQSIRVPSAPPAEFDGDAIKNAFAWGGLFGLALSAAVGGVTNEGISDPAMSIRFEIASAMANRFAMQIVPEDDPEADLRLDIRTTDWGIVSTHIDHYGAKYSGVLVLTDLRTNEVLARSICSGDPIDEPDNPTLEELKEGGSARLKQMLRAAARYCLEDFRKRTLGLYQ
jgi:hypothetical protein